MDFALEILGDEAVMRYPESEPYVLRDQSARPSDETIKVVLSDIVAVLETMRDEYELLAEKAQSFVLDADGLDEEDDSYYEYLMDILQQAEQLEHILVDWNGDTGMVSTSISDYWYEYEGPIDE